MIEPMLKGVLIGLVATACLDTWAAIAKHILKLPTADWAMVGRWFGHMPRGVFLHQPISRAAPVRNELTLGWIGHYLIGVLYGTTYVYIVRFALDGEPSLISGLGFGIATLFAPWLIMQPAMGAGVFASRTPRPAVVRLMNISMHALFGVSLYVAWLVVS